MIRRDAVHDDRPALGVAGPQRQDLLVGRLAAAAPLGDLLGLAPSLLRALGGFLVLFAVTVWLVAARAAPAPAAVTALIGANVLWVIGSLAFAAVGAGSPSTVGSVWTVVQALVVALFAALQAAALRGHGAGA